MVQMVGCQLGAHGARGACPSLIGAVAGLAPAQGCDAVLLCRPVMLRSLGSGWRTPTAGCPPTWSPTHSGRRSG